MIFNQLRSYQQLLIHSIFHINFFNFKKYLKEYKSNFC